jgi:hypothetical protein
MTLAIKASERRLRMTAQCARAPEPAGAQRQYSGFLGDTTFVRWAALNWTKACSPLPIFFLLQHVFAGGSIAKRGRRGVVDWRTDSPTLV